jgi:apolipoprotein D and lipocalin family protein
MYSLQRFLLVIIVLLGLSGCINQPVYRTSNAPLNTVSTVDLKKYQGLWYEIYRLPNWFEDKDCLTITAQYSPLPENKIQVLNTCYKKDKAHDAKGIAKIEDQTTSAKLKVSFFRPFYGDYWILDLANDYSWALIGEPSGKYFWILARERKLNHELEEQLLKKAEALGYLRKDFIKPENLALSN